MLRWINFSRKFFCADDNGAFPHLSLKPVVAPVWPMPLGQCSRKPRPPPRPTIGRAHSSSRATRVALGDRAGDPPVLRREIQALSHAKLKLNGPHGVPSGCAASALKMRPTVWAFVLHYEFIWIFPVVQRLNATKQAGTARPVADANVPCSANARGSSEATAVWDRCARGQMVITWYRPLQVRSAVHPHQARWLAVIDFGSSSRILPNRRSNSTGLVSNSSHPAASAFSRSPASAWAERPIIGM